MNILKNIIERLNQKLDASNIFGSIYGLAEQAPDDPKKLYVYIGSGQGELVTDYDKTQGTAFWRLRSAVTMRQTEVLRPIGCQEMYIATYPLRCYAYVKKNSLPCDSNAVEGWVMDMFWKYVAGKDTALRTNLGVTDIFFRPVSTTPNTPDLPANFEWVHLYFDLDVEVTAKAIESCYDECGVNPIPLPNGQCPPINRVQSVTGLDTDNTDPSNPIVRISVDGSTITGSGTPSDPLVAIGGGGGGSNLRVQDEGTTVTNAATTLNFTGNVTASLASAGNVTVNVPAPTAQVNADWNAVSGVAEILNKPTIPAAQIQSDWNQANNAAVDFIKNKPTIPSITGLVPYTGATADVDLGANGLDAEFVRVTGTNGAGDIHLRHQATDATATGQSTSIFADANGDVKIKNDGLSYATFKTSLISANRIYTFPDKSGTVAMTSDVQVYTEGTGIDITSNVITNTAPDQTVVLNEGTGIDVTGAYPNFTIANTAPDQTVVLTAGTGIGVTGTYPNFTIANTLNGIVRSEYTASNAAFLDIPIPSGYSRHKIIYINVFAAVANAELWQRVGIGAPSVIQSGASDYTHWRSNFGTSQVFITGGLATDSKIVFIGAAMPTGANGRVFSGTLNVFSPDNSLYNKNFNGDYVLKTNSGNLNGGTFHSSYNANTPITSLRLLASTGNISGVVIIESYL